MAAPRAQKGDDVYVQQLKTKYVGTSLVNAPVPSAVLDLAKVESNCTKMLEAVDALGCGWRAHIKTHKTTELTRLQVGPAPRPMNLVVSTLLEAENITPLILEAQKEGRKCDLLYGFPLNASAVDRLSKVAEAIGPSNLSIMVDHVGQLEYVHALYANVAHLPSPKVNLYVKIDMGGARAGVVYGSQSCIALLELVKRRHMVPKNEQSFNFVGLYSHAGHSYSGNDRAEALSYLNKELSMLLCITTNYQLAPRKSEADEDFYTRKPFVLTVGATPTTTSLRNLLSSHTKTEAEDIALQTLRLNMEAIKAKGCVMEIHAGVYPVLDIQQLATHALHENDLNWDNLALTILTEVASLYPEREHPEALIVAGILALGRDPCKAYPGWGIVSPWQLPTTEPPFRGPPEQHKGWQVAKVSQEHGILRWTGDKEAMTPLAIGQKLRIWPNHACIAGAGFEYYLIVDSRNEGREDEIVDVWVRWNGW